MQSQASTCKCKKSSIIAVAVGLTIPLLALFGLNTYFYLNPLDEPGVGFQIFLPSALLDNVTVTTTKAKIVALRRDSRHDRKDWLGWDLDRARLEVTMKDRTGKYIADIVEQPEFDNCTPSSQGYHTAANGLPYCLHTNTQQKSVTSTTINMSRHTSISVANGTSIIVNVE